MKRKTQFAAVMVAAVFVSALPALAQGSRVYKDGNGWVEELTGTIPASKILRVNTDIGSVRVQGGNQNEIHYTIRKHSYTSSEESARHSFEQFRVAASKRGDTALFEGNSEGNHGRKFSVEFSLEAPRGIELAKLNTDGGSMSVRGITGRIEAESGGGNIQFDDIGGSINAETGGGSIDVGTANADLNLHTGGGSIKVASAKGKVVAGSGGGSIFIGSAGGVDLETGGGSIEVESCRGSGAKTQTGGGSIRLGDVSGPASMETGGGSIRLSGAKGFVKAQTGGGSIDLEKLTQGVRAETGAGRISAEFVGNSTTDYSVLETSVGDIIVYIAPNVNMSVHAEIQTAMGHKIRSDFPELKITSEGGDYGPKAMFAEGNLNGGGPKLKVMTNLGNIEFRKR
ncbi:MAG TPA: hypothetical protein VK473_02750 [Terriglobales bacterium]|nr:hypothetical protein [Terriglobales bacterium]